MIKNERGITLVALILTVVLMLILVAAGINYGGSSISQVKLQNFSYEMQQIQGRVDSIHEKMKLLDNPTYIVVDKETMGVDVTSNAKAKELLKKFGIDYAGGTLDTEDTDYYTPQGETVYRYFSKRNLEEQLDIKNAKSAMIINFKTREVISVEGHNYQGTLYFRLKDIK